MPLQDNHQIVSVDDHLVEHPRVWQDRLPAKYREAGPRIIERDGKHLWSYDGVIYPTIGLNAVAGRPMQEWGLDPVRYEDMIPGCYDPVARIADMDLDGTQAALCFPSFPGFAGGTFQRAQDKELALLCVKAWNDFYIEEWCPTAPERYIPLALLPTWDIDACVAEAERTAAMGARTVSFPDSPVPLGLPSFHSDHWDPLWQICSEAQMPVSMHFGSGGYVPGFSFSSMEKYSTLDAVNGVRPMPDSPYAVAITLFATNLMWSTVDLLLSGKLQKFPDLQFSLAEGGIGWLPYILERTDYVWERHRYYQPIDFDTRPSELFRKHFYGCFIDDEHGLANRHMIGIDRITLETDFPHSDSSWPNSRKRAAEVLANVPDDECALIVEENARRMLRFPRTPAA
ncbi:MULTISPECIES: amidohydrolase family protein [Mycobacterium]|uniref:amidohydrolase family protein n=1 Tax=Mycobacterium TaxID=1763 RepID=UPI0008024F85|nr:MULTISPECIES: amidohydrolase family protein [Mycobacterium]OBK35333.1 amidohydrolase [Mycobacterium sp. 1245111.1]BCP08106.1 amidohydrolase [Mycobacterium paraintracellulare]